MSIGMVFDDDYGQALAEHKTRNGMSVQEIYEALDQRDQLIEQLQKERDRYSKLEKHVRDACFDIARTATQYVNLAECQDAGTSYEDRLEFLCRAKGLKEAVNIMRRSLEDENEG